MHYELIQQREKQSTSPPLKLGIAESKSICIIDGRVVCGEHQIMEYATEALRVYVHFVWCSGFKLFRLSTCVRCVFDGHPRQSHSGSETVNYSSVDRRLDQGDSLDLLS